MSYKVTLGYCGPTDCCLILTRNQTESRQYGIESDSWRVCSFVFHRCRDIELDSSHDAWFILDLLWNCGSKEDIFNEDGEG